MTGFIITLLIIILKIPFINILGDKGIGYFSIALIIYFLLTTLISYGLPKAISTEINRYTSKGQYQLVYKIVQTSFLYAVITGLFGSLLLFSGADFIADKIIHAESCAQSIRAFAPALLFSALLGTFHGICIGLRKSAVSQIAHMLEGILVSLLCLVFVILCNRISMDYEAASGSFYASIGYVSGIVIVFIFMFIFYIKNRKKIRNISKKYNSDIDASILDISKSIISSMIPVVILYLIFHFSNLMDYVVFNKIMSVQGHKENSYIILLGMLNGKYEFFISLPLIFIYKLSLSKCTEFKKIFADGNYKKLNFRINNYIRQHMLFIIPCIFIFIFYSKPLMNLLFTGINETPSLLLRVGAVSILFYSLAIISNVILNAAEQWNTVIKNAFISLIIQVICLWIMMIIFEWRIVAVVIARIIFSASMCILNEHVIREHTGHVLEKKRTFLIPCIASSIMSIASLCIFVLLRLFIEARIAVLFVLPLGIIVYIITLALLGGITQKEIYRIPGGKYLAPLCRKIHFLN